jgi:parallel beta-helix repeat protein
VDQVIHSYVAGNFIGVYLNQTTDNVLADNTITDNTSTGINMFGTLTADNVVQGNRIIANTDGQKHPRSGVGVYIESGQNNLILGGNTISKNALVGVYLFDRAAGNQVQSNTITGNHQYGVFLYNSGGNVSGISRTGKTANKLRGNTIADFREFTGPVLPRQGQSPPTPVKARRAHAPHRRRA